VRADSFRRRIALVTGAASGIGLALSQELADRGATVVLADLDLERNEEAARALCARGAEATARRLDVTDPESVSDVVRDTAARHGRIDYLFNNAGINTVGEALHFCLDDWEHLLSVNVRGVIHGVHAVYPIMVTQGSGHIVNVASLAALVPSPFQVAYATTKHAVLGLSVSLRAEARKYGVRVSAVCPGFIATRMGETQRVINVERARVDAAVPLRPYPAARCARDILHGVARNQEIILVTAFARWAYRARRWCPALASAVAGRVGRRGL